MQYAVIIFSQYGEGKFGFLYSYIAFMPRVGRIHA
jgi:hypothetical protein